tara:strand:+ start:884 stop:1957 length:1074 start_codon:yes stop_codon:yes gene_type:complete
VIYQIKPVIGNSAKKNIIKYIKGNNWLTEYKKTAEFEKKFAKFTNSKYCIAFPNGTLTMYAILECLNLKKNSEVLVSNYTMVATANIVKMSGLKLKLVDISDKDLCMCPIDLKKKITNKTKVVIYTPMNGRVGQINEIKKICRKKGIYLVEDAAHAIGSYNNSKHVGSAGIAASFSFSMPKLITMGQGGAIITNNSKLAKKLRLFKNFGRLVDGVDIHNHIGYNFKITDLQSILATSQLLDIKKRMVSKKVIFQRYYRNLVNNKKIKLFRIKNNETPWSVDIYIKNRNKVKKILKQKKILTRNVYPPLNSQKIYKSFKSKYLKVSNNYCKNGLWLPSSLDLKLSQIDKICKILNKII